MNFVEIFLKLGTRGYVAVSDSPTLWKLLPECDEADASDFRGRSDESLASYSNSKQSLLPIIRGESLRCLNLLIRCDNSKVIDFRMSVFSEGVGRPGLPVVALLDTSYHARRFALYCMVSLLVPRNSDGPGVRGSHQRRVTPEIRVWYLDAISCVTSMLKRKNEEDRSSVAHVLWDMSQIMGYITSRENNKVHSEVCHALIYTIRRSPNDAVKCESLMCLGRLVSEYRGSIDCEKEIENLLESIEPSSPLNLPAASLLDRFHSNIPTARSNSILVSAINSLEDLRFTKALTPSQRYQVKSLLEKLGYISTLDSKVEHAITGLSRNPPDWSVDALMVGLGKLSRTSARALEVVLKSDLLVTTKFPSSRVIQAIGDIVFSCIIYNVDDVVVRTLSCNLSRKWLYSEEFRGASLRTIMTGLARVSDSGSQIVHQQAFEEIHTCSESFLLKLWTGSGNSRDERLLADSIRCIGLLMRVTDMSASFITASRAVIIQALLSGRTQRVLAALATIRAKPEILPQRDITIIDDVLEETCSKLEGRTVWDYDSADTVAGQLHIILEAWLLCANVVCPKRSSPSIQRRVRKILSGNPKLRKLERYNPCITTFLDRLGSVFRTPDPCVTHDDHQQDSTFH